MARFSGIDVSTSLQSFRKSEKPLENSITTKKTDKALDSYGLNKDNIGSGSQGQGHGKGQGQGHIRGKSDKKEKPQPLIKKRTYSVVGTTDFLNNDMINNLLGSNNSYNTNNTSNTNNTTSTTNTSNYNSSNNRM